MHWRFKYVPDHLFDNPPLLSVRPAAGGGDGTEGVLTLGWVRAGLARFEVWLEDDGPSDPRWDFHLSVCRWYCLFYICSCSYSPPACTVSCALSPNHIHLCPQSCISCFHPISMLHCLNISPLSSCARSESLWPPARRAGNYNYALGPTHLSCFTFTSHPPQLCDWYKPHFAEDTLYAAGGGMPTSHQANSSTFR